jgi:hypothetical protein
MHHNHKDFAQHFTMRSILQKTETRRLHDGEMKRLVRIFRHVPAPSEERNERKEGRYRRYTKNAIQHLPSRLRTSWLSFGTTDLCSLHQGLNQNLVNDIWGWLRHEFNGAIGLFLWPLLISQDLLTDGQRFKARQLEPVLQMWQPNFSLEQSAPPGDEPIQCGTKWHYQTDQCPACMMARIGSDEDVLFALVAGMVGRINSKPTTTMDTLRSVAGWDSTKSKRLRLVRYWLRKASGETTASRALEFGMELTRLHTQCKHEQNRRLRAPARTRTHETPIHRGSLQNLGSCVVNRTGHQQSFGRSARTRTTGSRPQEVDTFSLFDPKLGPKPRPPDAKRLSPADDLGFEMPNMRERAYTISHEQQDVHPAFREPPRLTVSRSSTYAPQRFNKSQGSDDLHNLPKADDSTRLSTVRLPQHHNSRDRSATFQIRRRPVPKPRMASSHNRENSCLNPSALTNSRPSFATTAHTIASYTGGPSSRANCIDPLDNPIYNHIETPEERLEKYKRLLARRPDDSEYFAEEEEDDTSTFPMPHRSSMYSAFGNVAFNPACFDVIDEGFAADESENWERDGSEEDEEEFQGYEVDRGMRLGKERYRRGSDTSVRSDNFY